MYDISTTITTKEMVVVAAKTDTISKVAEKKYVQELEIKMLLHIFLSPLLKKNKITPSSSNKIS